MYMYTVTISDSPVTCQIFNQWLGKKQIWLYKWMPNSYKLTICLYLKALLNYTDIDDHNNIILPDLSILKLGKP